jgi:polysaccharide export outer membrane protein
VSLFRPRPCLPARGAARAALAVAVALAAGAVAPPRLPALPPAPAAGAASRPRSQPPAAAARDAAGAPARDSAAGRAAAVAVGDRVRVRVWREPQLSDEFVVDDQGAVIFPRLGRVHVAGRSIGTLQDTLTARYAEYLRSPEVTVTVLRRVGVQGEVRAPNLYYVDVTKSLREVLAEAGGITEAGNPDRVMIVRDGRQLPLGRWRDGGPLAAELRSGDQVFVARRSWLSRNALAAVSTLGLVVSVAVQVVNSRR